jgi:membrane-associated phospholipid phosphatase
MTAKLTGLSLVLAADSFRHHSVSTIQGATHRTRPTGSGEGFPSSYASGIALTSTLTHGNLRSTPLPGRVRLAGDVGLFMLAAAGSWARVESGEHYPSDVLVGMAFGHLVASFLNDAFLHRPDPMHLGPQPPIPPPPVHAGRTRFTGGPRGTFGLGVYGEF